MFAIPLLIQSCPEGVRVFGIQAYLLGGNALVAVVPRPFAAWVDLRGILGSRA